MDGTDQIQIQWLKGEIKFEPVKYTVRSVETGKWWWKKVEYYIDSEFESLGPFETSESVVEALNVLNR